MNVNDEFQNRFHGIGRLFGAGALEKFKNASILVIGIGGVGSWAAESLVRSGIGHLCLVDLDDICLSNVNRQVHALTSTIGKLKVEVLKDRLLDINPACKIDIIASFFSVKNASEILSQKYDFILDACDDFTHKSYLICKSFEEKLPLLTIGAAGGKKFPHLIWQSDLTETQNDLLIARIRKNLRQKHHFPRKGKWKIPCITSKERALYSNDMENLCNTTSTQTKNMDCDKGYGSASFVTGTFAFMATSYILNEINSL